jgi:hypothetical protein
VLAPSTQPQAEGYAGASGPRLSCPRISRPHRSLLVSRLAPWPPLPPGARQSWSAESVALVVDGLMARRCRGRGRVRRARRAPHNAAHSTVRSPWRGGNRDVRS